MWTLQFRARGPGDPPEGRTTRVGSAWAIDAGEIVTCLHTVSFDDLRWAGDDQVGDYLLVDDGGRAVATLDPVLAIPSLDVALLSVPRIAGKVASVGAPLALSTDWFPEGTQWVADARPVQLRGHPVRLSGKLARWGGVGRHWHQLTVDQGTDIDWASVSGSPVLHGGSVVGMLKQQLDRGNTCFAVPAHAIALLRWLARDLPVVTDLATRCLAPPADVFSAPSRVADRLAEMLARPGVTVEGLGSELGIPDDDNAARQVLRTLLAKRPEAPPDSAEEDLCRRALRMREAAAGPTSDSLLRMVFPSAGPSTEVFVPPRFRQFQEAAAGSPSPANVDDERGAGDSGALSYADFLATLAAAPPEAAAHRLAVLGEAGAGKSTLLSHLARQILEDGLGLAVQFHFQQLGQADMLNAIDRVWLPSLGATGPSYLHAVQQLAGQRRLWILIDGVDEVGLTHREPLAQIARGLGGVLQGAHVVVASRHAYWYHGVNDLHGFKVYDLEVLGVERVPEVIGQWFGGDPEGRQLVDRLRDPARHYLLQAVRNPLRLAMLCAVWRHAVRQQPAGVLPSTRAELYETFLALTYEWNARRRGLAQVDRDGLFAALSRLALHVLANPVTATADGAGAFDEAVIHASNPGLSPDERRALVESGLLARDGAAPSLPRRFRFEHRTWLEYFAARGLQRGTELLDLDATPQRTWVVETGWREILLFWMGRTDVAFEEKQSLLQRMSRLDDEVWGLYGDRALHLVPACLRECPCLDDEDVATVFTRIMRQAVGVRDSSGTQWLVAFPTLRAAAAAGLAEGDPKWVGDAAWEAFRSAQGVASGTTFAFAMASVLVESAADDEQCGQLAAALLLHGPFLRSVPRADALLDNPRFVAELVKSASRRDEGARARRILNHADDGSPAAVRIAFELLRNGVGMESVDCRRLLRMLASQRPAAPDTVALLERRAFDECTPNRADWLKALGAVTPDTEGLGDRVLADWAGRDDLSEASWLELLSVLASLERTSRDTALQVLAWSDRWLGGMRDYDAVHIVHKACRAHPGLAAVFLGLLSDHTVDRTVASSLQDFQPRESDESVLAPLRVMMQRDQSAVRFECARILLDLLPNPCADREAALATLDQLVEEFQSPHARQLETPWRAGSLLRSLHLERPGLVSRLIAMIEESSDEDVWGVAANCLGNVGSGSRAAIRCLMALATRPGVHSSVLTDAMHALSRVGPIGPDDARKLVAIASARRDDVGIRWMLEAMKDLSVDESDAAELAADVALSGQHDGLTVESAFALLRMSTRHAARARDVALALVSSPEEPMRKQGLEALLDERTPSTAVTRALLDRLDVEDDARIRYLVRRALAVQITGRAEGLMAIPRLKHELTRDVRGEAADERRDLAYALLREVAARTPYIEFKARWNSPEVFP